MTSPSRMKIHWPARWQLCEVVQLRKGEPRATMTMTAIRMGMRVGVIAVTAIAINYVLVPPSLYTDTLACSFHFFGLIFGLVPPHPHLVTQRFEQLCLLTYYPTLTSSTQFELMISWDRWRMDSDTGRYTEIRRDGKPHFPGTFAPRISTPALALSLRHRRSHGELGTVPLLPCKALPSFPEQSRVGAIPVNRGDLTRANPHPEFAR